MTGIKGFSLDYWRRRRGGGVGKGWARGRIPGSYSRREGLRVVTRFGSVGVPPGWHARLLPVGEANRQRLRMSSAAS